jgi:hypothetical protein
MFAGRRFALIGTVVAVVWYVCIVAWATQSTSDSVPVGVDRNLVPPKLVSVSVTCQGVFDSASRDDSPLPALDVQPKNSPPLKFQREPCLVVHQQARIVFALDTALFGGVLACSVYLAVRRRRSTPSAHPNTDSRLAGSLTG